MEKIKLCPDCDSYLSISKFNVVNVKHQNLKKRCKSCDKENSKLRKIERRKSADRNRFFMSIERSKRSAEKGNFLPVKATARELGEKFTGKCHICFIKEIDYEKKLSMDHCHKTGLFRGWLCSACNVSLGGFKDSPELLRAAISYLCPQDRR